MSFQDLTSQCDQSCQSQCVLPSRHVSSPSSFLCSIHIFSAPPLLFSLSLLPLALPRGRTELLQTRTLSRAQPPSSHISAAHGGGLWGCALGLHLMNVPCDGKAHRPTAPPQRTDRPILWSQTWPQSRLLRPEAFLSGKYLCLLPTNTHYFPSLDVQTPTAMTGF